MKKKNRSSPKVTLPEPLVKWGELVEEQYCIPTSEQNPILRRGGRKVQISHGKRTHPFLSLFYYKLSFTL